jgi:hypothetical protein
MIASDGSQPATRGFQSDGLAAHIVHPDGRARPNWEYATEPEALPLEEVSLPEDPEITSLSNHGALTLEELASRISDFSHSQWYV